MRIDRVIAAAALGLAVVGTGAACGDGSTPPVEPTHPTGKPSQASDPPATVPAPAESAEPVTADPEAGRADYQTYCASCHGPGGDGDGPVAAGLDPKPARHSDGSLMNSLSNDYLFRVIKDGGLAVGKSAMMAPWGQSLSDQQIHDLVAFIRTLADPPFQL